jgi:hypothetical protein
VVQAGVGPDDFYVTAIYPTEISVNGQWIPVQAQRMDAAIAVTQTADGPIARCKLLRDLQVGESVVIGSEGIRTRRKDTSLKPRSSPKNSALWAQGCLASAG